MVPNRPNNQKGSLFQRWALDEDIQDNYVTQCFYCTHLERGDVCSAFPNGIPQEIMNNLVVHQFPYLNDNNIKFHARNKKYAVVKFKPLSRAGNATSSNRMLSGLIGLCIGDALGVPVEFSTREGLKKHPVTDMIGYGMHDQPKGTWSDDSSLTFCLGESLCDGYDIFDIAAKIKSWYKEGRWTAYDEVFDIGRTTLESIERLIKGKSPFESGGRQSKDNGNGSLMRILPLAFYLQNITDTSYKYKVIKEVSMITHAHPRAILACAIYVDYAISLLKGNSIQNAMYEMKENIINFYNNESTYTDELEYYKRILSEELINCTENEISSSGYVVDTLEASLWCFMTTHDYESAVLKAVNLGGDTDTIAALVGGLAGIYYGMNEMPYKWIEMIPKKDKIIELGNTLYKIFRELPRN